MVGSEALETLWDCLVMFADIVVAQPPVEDHLMIITLLEHSLSVSESLLAPIQWQHQIILIGEEYITKDFGAQNAHSRTKTYTFTQNYLYRH